MSRTGSEPESARTGAADLSALLEDSAEDLYDNAPCGYLSTLLDGTIVKVNATLLSWLGYRRHELLGRRRFVDLLSVGGRLYHETHYAPLLRMQGTIGGVALELVTASGDRLPVLVSSVLRTGQDGRARLIRTTVFDAGDRRAYERELLHARQRAERERDRARQLVTTLQRTLLPPLLPDVPGLDVAAHYRIASTEDVGGDFYDVFPLSDGRWGCFLGDVSGKGTAAAAVTSLTRYTLRAAAVYDADPLAVLGNLNTVLYHEDHLLDARYCTVVYGLLTPHGNGCDVVLASGGHPPALLLRADGTASFVATPGGQLVGALPDAQFVSATVHLAAGDTLLLYTDGLTEARVDAARTRYSEEDLFDFLVAARPTTATGVVAAVADLLDGFADGLDDDTALLCIGVPAVSGGD